jgi:2'-5' RNA ligase
VRLFVALQPPPELARALHARAAQILAPCARELRFHAPEELHLTLVFLGESALRELPQLGAAPLELELAGGGAFPDLRRPRVVWAGARELPGSAGRLAELVRGLRASLGLAPDPEPFRAHLTLARPRPGARPRLPAELAELALPGVWRADAPALFESRQGERPRYRRLA